MIINLTAAAHMVIVRPFDELKENINSATSEIAFASATLFLPLLLSGRSVSLAGDLMIYVLMGSTIANGIVSSLFIVPTLVELYRKYCKKGIKIKDEFV